MIYCPDKYLTNLPKINEEMAKLKGELSDKDARISLAKFMRANIGFSTYLLCGKNMRPYQEMTIKAFFNRNFSLCVWGRGSSKTWSAAVYCFLQCIFEPNTHIIIAGPTFRTARNIFTKIEEIAKSKEAKMLQEALYINDPAKRNDQFEWLINGGSIKAIPLNGEKIRGFRANILVLDEFLLMSQDIVDNVLKPFLTVPMNLDERIKITEQEDQLIKEGLMTEKDRYVFPNTAKMICLSSASYSWEFLYELYKNWCSKIMAPIESESEEDQKNKYFVSQLSWEAIPRDMLDQAIIREAESGGSSNASFQREYCSRFQDSSDSYLSAKKMSELTIKDGEDPCVKIVGDKNKKYILSIDPSFSQSSSSDHFAMAVLEIDEKSKTCLLVHCYAKAGLGIKSHINYLYYIMTHFNIVYIICDNADGNFIQAVNESELFKKAKLQLEFMEFDTALDGKDYELEVKKARNIYNLEAKKICVKQTFTSDSIRKGAENLQMYINRKQIWFASKLTANGSEFEKAERMNLPFELLTEERPIPEDFISLFISDLDNLIFLTKAECSLIEVKTGPTGNQTFDLPRHLRRNQSAKRARKDSFTVLLLGCFGYRSYLDMMEVPAEEPDFGFTPFAINPSARQNS